MNTPKATNIVKSMNSDRLMFNASLFVENERLAKLGELPQQLIEQALSDANEWLPLYHAEIAHRFGPPDCCCPYPGEYAKPYTTKILSSLCKVHGEKARPDLWAL